MPLLIPLAVVVGGSCRWAHPFEAPSLGAVGGSGVGLLAPPAAGFSRAQSMRDMGMVASGRCRCTIPCEAPVMGAVAVDRVGLLARLPEPSTMLAVPSIGARWTRPTISEAVVVWSARAAVMGAPRNYHSRLQATDAVRSPWKPMAATPGPRVRRQVTRDRSQQVTQVRIIGSGSGSSCFAFRAIAAGHVLPWLAFASVSSSAVSASC